MPTDKKESWTLFVLPCETADNGRSLGLNTRIRLSAALEAVEKFPVSDIVLAAGISPDKKSGQIEPFTILMEKWIRSSGSVRLLIHKSEDTKVWTSFAEIVEAMKIIEKKNLPKNIIVVSTKLHLYPRLWVTWKILKPHDWNVKFYPAGGSVDILHEILGTFAYILKSLRKKFFN